MDHSPQGQQTERLDEETAAVQAIGVDIGGTEVKAGIVDARGTILREITWSTRAELGPAAVLNRIQEGIGRLLGEAGSAPGAMAGIGIGCPGLVDPGQGLVRVPPNLPGWVEVPLKATIEQAVGLPTVIANDVNAMALGELHYGAGRGYRQVICLTLGTGVGGALIFDGQLYTGVSGTAGEIGHMTVEPQGPLCNCGNRGCLERFIGSRAIVERAREKLKSWPEPSRLTNLQQADLNPKIIAEAARAGDEVALDVFSEVGEILGIVLAGLVNLLNPEVIIIGGGVAGAGDCLFGPAAESMRRRSYALPGETVRLLPAQLGHSAGLIGAATLVLSTVPAKTHRT